MALCPLAIASKGNANDGTGEFYFALNGGSSGPVVDSAFLATGLGTPPNQGSFTARSEDTTGAGTGAFIIQDISGVTRWAIGVDGVEAGANSGSDLAVFAYADNGGFLTAPLLINRASGGVSMPNGLTVGNTLISTGPASVGTAATVGGGLLEIEGTLGLGRVFDAVYNPAIPAQTAFAAANNAVVPNAPAPGTNTVLLGGTFTVPRSGMYILTGLLSYDGAPGTTFTAASEDFFTVNCNPSPPSPGSGFGGVTVSLTNATAVDRAWEATATLLLTAGIPYQANLILQNNSGTVAATGAAVLNGSFDLVALC
jgi:hypothetical protein